MCPRMSCGKCQRHESACKPSPPQKYALNTKPLPVAHSGQHSHPGRQSHFLVSQRWQQIECCRSIVALADGLLHLLLKMYHIIRVALCVVKDCIDGTRVVWWPRSMAGTIITRQWPWEFWASVCHFAKKHTAEPHGMSIGQECRPPCLALLGHCLQMLQLMALKAARPVFLENVALYKDARAKQVPADRLYRLH